MRPLTNSAAPLFWGVLAAAVAITACKKKSKDDHTHSPTLQSDSVWVKVEHADSRQGRHVDLEFLLHTGQNGQVREGYNRIRIKAERYNGASLRLIPIMYMSNHSHSCPTRQPEGRATDGYFYAEAFFQMPTTVDGNGNVTEPWKFHIVMEGGDTAIAEVRIYPHPNRWVRRKRFNTSMGEVRLMYEFRPDGAFRVGSVPASFFVYRQDMNRPHEDPNGFVPATEVVSEVHLKTWMPSMGHGAEGTRSAAPVSGTYGVYRGQLGFNMTGDWDIYVAFVKSHRHGDHMHTDTVGRDTFSIRF